MKEKPAIPPGSETERLLWVIEVQHKLRKGQPVEAVAITTGGMVSALVLAKNIAGKLNIPQSWVNPVIYRREIKP